MRPTNADTGVVGAHAVPAQDAGQLPGGVLHPLGAATEDEGGEGEGGRAIWGRGPGTPGVAAFRRFGDGDQYRFDCVHTRSDVRIGALASTP